MKLTVACGGYNTRTGKGGGRSQGAAAFGQHHQVIQAAQACEVGIVVSAPLEGIPSLLLVPIQAVEERGTTTPVRCLSPVRWAMHSKPWDWEDERSLSENVLTA